MAVRPEKGPWKSGYKARVRLIPTDGNGARIESAAIKLNVSGNKTLPGLSEAEEWSFSTDDPEQEIAETIVGKFGGISALNYEVPYDPSLMETLVGHANTNFTVEIVYNDTRYSKIAVIEVFDCFLKTPGSTSGAANNTAPTKNIILQPRGGGLLADCLQVTFVDRS
jgi:hypothetical protein